MNIRITIVLVILVIVILIYSLKKLSKNPKEELLKIKDLLDKEVINEDEFHDLKTHLLKKIKGKRKLTKSLYDYRLRGVVGGLAEYFGWSTILLRTLFTLLTLLGPGLILYIILAIIMPEPEEPEKFKLENYRVQ